MASTEQSPSSHCSRETVLPLLLSNPNLCKTDARAYQSWIQLGLDLYIPQNRLIELKKMAKTKGSGLLHAVVAELIEEWFAEKERKLEQASLTELIFALKDNHLEVFGDALEAALLHKREAVAGGPAMPVPLPLSSPAVLMEAPPLSLPSPTPSNNAPTVLIPSGKSNCNQQDKGLWSGATTAPSYQQRQEDISPPCTATTVTPKSLPIPPPPPVAFIKREKEDHEEKVDELYEPLTPLLPSSKSFFPENVEIFVKKEMNDDEDVSGKSDNAAAVVEIRLERENEIVILEQQQKPEKEYETINLVEDEDRQCRDKRRCDNDDDNDSTTTARTRKRHRSANDDNDLDQSGFNAFHRAVKANRIRDVLHLINEGAEVNKRASDISNSTALHIAASYINDNDEAIEMLKLLIDKEARLFALTSTEFTFMDILMDKPCPISPPQFHKLVAFLVINVHTNFLTSCFYGNGGGSILQLAMKKSILGRQTIQFLNSKKVNLNRLSQAGNSLLYYAIWGGRSIDMIKYLIDDSKMDWRIKNRGGWNLLHVSARFCHEDAFEYFLKKEKSFAKQKNRDGSTPVDFIKRYHGDNQLMKKILEDNGISVDF